MPPSPPPPPLWSSSSFRHLRVDRRRSFFRGENWTASYFAPAICVHRQMAPRTGTVCQHTRRLRLSHVFRCRDSAIVILDKLTICKLIHKLIILYLHKQGNIYTFIFRNNNFFFIEVRKAEDSIRIYKSVRKVCHFLKLLIKWDSHYHLMSNNTK